MPTPIRRAVVVAVLVAALAGVDATAAVATDDAAAPSTVPSPTPPSSVEDNEFIPENANLTDCISAVPRPDCGSEARGGWRQTAIFAVLVLVLAIGGWRLITVVRRRDRARDEQVDRLDAARAAHGDETDR